MKKINTIDGIRQAKAEYSNEYNKGIEESGVFWAFGKDQFNENRTHKRKEIDDNSQMYNNYLSIGAGGYIHKADKPKLDNFLTNIAPKLKQQFLSKIDKNTFILYELLNHEAYYTYELDDTLDTMKNYYADITEDYIAKIFRQHARQYADF